MAPAVCLVVACTTRAAPRADVSVVRAACPNTFINPVDPGADPWVITRGASRRLHRATRISTEEFTVRKLILKMSITVDAFVSGMNGESDWVFSSADEGSREWTMQTVRETGLHIMGAKTFRGMALHWPYSTEVFAPLMNDIPKAVFSRDKSITSHLARETAQTKEANTVKDTKNAPPLDAATIAKNERSWKEARVMSGDLAKDIAQLKSENGKDIVAWGGAGFARSLIKLGLPDEYRLLVHPTALGSGLPIFTELPKAMALKLVYAKAFDKGAVGHVYQPEPSPTTNESR